VKTRLFVVVACIFFVMAEGRSLAGGKDDLAAAQAADQRGDRATALSRYSKALASGGLTEKERAAAYRGRALDERDQRQFDKAIADQTEAIKLVPDDEEAFIERGSTYAYAGHTDAALADFTTATGLKPNDVTALVDRGAIFAGQRNYERALADLNAALKAQPDNIDAMLNRAAALRGVGDKDGAIADLDKVIQLHPDLAGAYYERGNTFRDKGDNDRAIADYSTALRLKPDYAEAFNERGLTYQLVREYPKALRDLTTTIGLMPNSADAYYNRARVYRDLGQYDNAITDYDTLIYLVPRFPSAYNGRGYTNFHAGRFEAAAGDFKRSLLLAPRQLYPVLWLHLARLRARQFDTAEFATNLKAVTGDEWPAPIAAYLTHQITAAEVLAAAAQSETSTRMGRICDADLSWRRRAHETSQRHSKAIFSRCAAEVSDRVSLLYRCACGAAAPMIEGERGASCARPIVGRKASINGRLLSRLG
jgi:tetratricopeptide (TPR) repeat protein